uniref:Alkyl/aryl-sulfatase BDS1 n=1 Tax=Phallusia mammillata TaxID=59560 RepID=A0A6F9DL08_9ASCI|nr:alkyl/aryl-sulfatase BDS1 [Phallusia mammillata]
MVNAFIKCAAIAICAAVAWRWFSGSRLPPNGRDVQRVGALESLKEHSRKFDSEKIVQVTDGVHVAIGYALANMIMIEGTDGIILVDTMEHEDVAMKAFKDLRKITSKPLKGIIITHFHLDHVVGAVSLLRQHPEVHIYMHESTKSELARFVRLGEINFARGSRQFGIFLDEDKEKINAGIGPQLMQDANMMHVAPEATHTYKDRETFNLAGVAFELIHTPGETDDQTTVWLADKQVVFPADNIYETFPNLYAIRGSPPRSCEKWYKSLDKVRQLGAQHMVPSHTRPLSGKKEINDVITIYRDAIQYVHDQTVRWMNKGFGVNEIVHKVKLPPKLAAHPYLQEHYGTVAWSVRGVYDSLIGWFDGDPVNLYPLTKAQRAGRWKQLLARDSKATADAKILQDALNSLKASDDKFELIGECMNDELQWALELSSLAVEASENQVKEEAKSLHVRVLRSLAKCSNNANARHYYLTIAREIESGLKLLMTKNSLRDLLLTHLNIDELMSFFPLRFKAEECDENTLLTVGMVFTDIQKSYYYTVRNCMVEYRKHPDAVPPNVDATLTTTSTTWREMVVQESSTVIQFATGGLTVTGSMLSFRTFMNLIETSF